MITMNYMNVTWWGYFDCPDCGGSISNVQCPTCLARAQKERASITTYTDTTPRWISMKDHRPENGQKVIYYFKHVGVHIGRYHREIDEEGYEHDVFSGINGFLEDDVTHWIPIPELPE